MILTVWKNAGYYMLFYLAGLQTIPAELYEAARIEGAGWTQQFRAVTWPLLGPTTLFVLLIASINAFQAVDQIFLMTGGGPGTTSRVIAYTMYEETFANNRAGYGAAVAGIMLILMIPVMALNIRRFRSERVTN